MKVGKNDVQYVENGFNFLFSSYEEFLTSGTHWLFVGKQTGLYLKIPRISTLQCYSLIETQAYILAQYTFIRLVKLN